MTPKVINAWIRRVVALERKLDEFVETVQHAQQRFVDRRL
jgi:hypothetical protein